MAKSEVVSEFVIGGLPFGVEIYGRAPYIMLGRGSARSGVPLGPNTYIRHVGGEWFIGKWRDATLRLRGFTPKDVENLSIQVGLSIEPPSGRTVRRHVVTSPTWDALKAWVAAHPRLAAACRGADCHLKGWAERAFSENAEAVDSAEREPSRRRRPCRIDDAALRRSDVLMDPAWEESTPPSEKVRLAREALKISPLNADAHVLIASYAPLTGEQTIARWRMGVAAGERTLGSDFFEEEKGSFWLNLPARPYMRARLGLALELWRQGEKTEAVGHIEDMLVLNENDNQGNRFVLARWLHELGRKKELKALAKKFGMDPEEMTAEDDDCGFSP